MRTAYRLFAFFGLGSVLGSLLWGFRYDAAAPWGNHVFNIALYGTFAVVHLVMTRGWFKQAVYGSAAGSPIERQIYITVSVITWLAVLWMHRPAPGGSIVLPEVIRFAGHVGFVLSIVAFFEGATFAMLDGLLGVPGGRMTHSHGEETPLLTEGAYASVRHPMYRAALCAGLCSILIHANGAQVLWCVMIGATFVGFIPVEERQLLEARGDAYRAYMHQTQWRVFRGIW
jgi:protein-S-isoprenylcysteine O-methyltransferase Ste14